MGVFVGKGALLELVSRLSGRVIISSELSDSDFENVDMEALVAEVIERYQSSGSKVLGKKELQEILTDAKAEKNAPVQVEVIRPSDFKPVAKDIDPEFRARDVKIERTSSNVSDFVNYFQDRFTRIREIIRSYGNGFSGIIGSIESIKQYMNGRELAAVGMVYDKVITAKGNIMITLEDESGTVRVLFMRPARRQKDEQNEVFDAASKLVKDDVVAVKGKTWNTFVIASRILWPDVPIHQPNVSDDDVAIAMVSDVHVGHKLFMEKEFGKFLEWINGGVDNRKDLAEKIKYVVVAGDLVDGIGVYPEQDRELAIDDIYKQYSVFFSFLEHIPDYMEVFVIPGNHDAVQRAEPQPKVGNGFMKDFKRENVHMMTNPCYLNLHGVKILAYHGTSLDSVIRSIPGCTYSAPTDAMKEILRRRHLSPIYGGNIVVPSKDDALVINEVPDILHMGHIHKNGYDAYHGTLLVNSGTWQGRTGYQVKQGHVPSPGLLPIYETKSARLSVMDFNGL
ncbi:MAG: DNA-directed DNA polymerase II small subunit [Candidatus Micrarchaeota archaeon]|nr:DNA-directed DNA polymerase II small subunit [Candidatus Micrarchaeota archaeon]